MHCVQDNAGSPHNILFMKLSIKVLLILACLLVINLALGYYIQHQALLPRFSALEQEDAHDNIQRCLDALKRELHHLNLFISDWAAWDDTYAYVREPSEKYIKANLEDATFQNSKLNLVGIYDLSSRLVWGEMYDFLNEKQITIPGFLESTLPEMETLFSHSDVSSSIEGMLQTSRGPLLLVSRPIVTTSNEGPIRGTLLMGRFLDEAMRTAIAEQTRVNVCWWPVAGNALPTDERAALAQIAPNEPIFIDRGDEQILNAYATFPDINGRPGLLVKAAIPRRIAARGIEAKTYLLISETANGLLTLLIVLLLLQKVVLAPIGRLTQHVKAFSERSKSVNFDNQPWMDFTLHGDEIEMLSQAFEKLEAGVQQRAAQLLMTNEQLSQEILERRRSEEAVRASEQAYRTLSENLPGIVYRVFAEGQKQPQFFNRMLEDITGYGAHELKVSELCVMHSLILPEDRPAVAHTVRRAIDSGEAFTVEYRITHKDAHVQWLVERGQPAHGTTRALSHIDGVIFDITDQKRTAEEKQKLEVQLQRAQKMELIGTLAGGVAHDLNNVLGGITGYPELLLLDLPADSPLRKPLSAIKECGERAAAIVSDMLTLARRGVSVTETVNLNTIIAQYLQSREHAKIADFNPYAEVERKLEPVLLNVTGSPVHLTKMVMNLVSNACEAMPEGGKVRITTENVYLDRTVRGYDLVKEGEYVVLTVSDTGNGISREDIGRMFEPFYTKKVMGRSGTGLGMSVVWGTIKDHSGYIDVESTEGKGTTFRIYFPATRRSVKAPEEPVSLRMLYGKGEQILIVDDVRTQREIAASILERLNYKVAAVSSGEEALDYIQQHRADLLLLDMIMDPGIDGLETYKRILALHPCQKAIIASGFSETNRVQEAQKIGAGAYIKKPYTIEKIAQAVKAELAK